MGRDAGKIAQPGLSGGSDSGGLALMASAGRERASTAASGEGAARTASRPATPAARPAPVRAPTPTVAPTPVTARAAAARSTVARTGETGRAAPLPSSQLQRAMRVSAVDDPHEREAEAVADAIAGSPHVTSRADDAAAHAVRRLRGEVPLGGTAHRAASGEPGPVGAEGGDVPASVRGYVASPGGGSPLEPGLAGRLGTALGADLSSVRVHTGPQAQTAAAALGARAFTVGRDITLGAGESPGDVRLMAHEATHVVQQQAVQRLIDTSHARAEGVARDAAPPAPAMPGAAAGSDSLIPDFILDAVRSFARNFPGYTLMTVIAGYDPIAGEAVARTPENLVAGVIGLVPFGNDLVARLRESELVQRIFTVIESGLTQHNLTRERFAKEISTAWDELSVTNGIDGNLAVIERHIRAVTSDVLAFAMQMVEAVMAAIREAAVGLAEAAVLRPAIQPTWSLATKVFHRDPLRGTDVQATTVEIISDLLRLAKRDEVLEQLQSNGRLQKAADWIDGQLAQFGSLYTEAVTLFSDAWAALSPANIARLVDIITGLAERAVGLFARVVGFVGSLLDKALELVKDALLGRLSAYARRSRAFPLLTVVLGADPFTGEAVPRNAENLVHGFIALLPGGEETYAKLQESGAIAQAGAKIEGAMTSLGITGDFIANLFTGLWNSFSLQDLLQPLAAFERVLAAFEEPLQRLFSFVSTVVMAVVEVILQIMNFPGELLGSIMGNISAAFDKIVQDPVGFLINLLGALKAGVSGFLGKAATYVKDGLVAWLTRGLGGAGIKLPADFTLPSVLGLVFDVLGVTVNALWDKLGKHVGAPLVEKLKGGVELAGEAWGWLTAFMNEGLGALWRFLGDKLEGLWGGILDAIEGWVVTEVIEAAGAKLLSMLDPTGVMAVINSCVAFFRAVQSAVEYLREILGIINEYTSTLAAVAMGNLAAGAAKLEGALASAVPVAIGFLTKQVGLQNVPEKLVEIIGTARTLIDEALDWLIGQAVRIGGAALKALGFGGKDGEPDDGADPAGKPADPDAVNEEFIAPDGSTHHVYMKADHTLMVASDPTEAAKLARLNRRIASVVSAWTALGENATTAQRKSVASRLVAVIKAVLTDETMSGEEKETLLRALGIVGDLEAPGKPAPNIGHVAKHGAQPSRLQAAGMPKVWALESEHVIPRSYGSSLMEAFGLPKIDDGEYDQLTTILIYVGAADEKTDAPNADASLLRQLRDRAGGDGDRGEGKPWSQLVDKDTGKPIPEKMRRAFGILAIGAKNRTVRAVVAEAGQKHPALTGTKTNAQRRGSDASPEPATPTASGIQEAYDTELAEILALFEARLAEVAPGG